MASLKQFAGCLGLAPPLSVVRDFYGYTTGAPGSLSLRQQMQVLRGPHVHLNLIRVGIEAFTFADEVEIDAAVYVTRKIYSTVAFGVGRVLRWFITIGQADGMDHIDSMCEALALWEAWDAPNDGVDVFFVRTDSGDFGSGAGPKDGSCEIEGKDGVVVSLLYGLTMTGEVVAGIAVAHEVGHYLGLDHAENPSNLMFGDYFPTAFDLTSEQGAAMKEHCFVKSGCQGVA